MAAVGAEGATTGNTIRNTAVALHTEIVQQRINSAGIHWDRGKRTLAKIKDWEAGGAAALVQIASQQLGAVLAVEATWGRIAVVLAVQATWVVIAAAALAVIA
jgi:hypothetical protein